MDIRRTTPKRDQATYTLDSGEAWSREAPDTFAIPPARERGNLTPGRQWAKLLFRIRIGSRETVERMWVLVQERHPGYYLGTLDNQPYNSVEHIRHGMIVRFEPKHVIQIRDVPATEEGR